MINENNFNTIFEDNCGIYELSVIINLYASILNHLETRGSINLIENERFKKIRKYLDTNKKSNDLNENSVTMQKIKKIEENILTFFKNKKEYEYINDYYTGYSKNVNNNYFNRIDIDKYDNDNDEKDNDERDNDIKNEVNENDFQKFQNIISSLTKFYKNDEKIKKNSLCDLLPITSNEFLKTKLKLDDEEILEIKGRKQEDLDLENKIVATNNLTTISENELNTTNNLTKNFLNIIKETKEPNKYKLTSAFLSNKTKVAQAVQTSNSNPDIKALEKEMEEEVNNEIFNYTKNMKQYARSFNEILTHDNRKLDNIEKNQEGGKSKTDRSMKSLKEFSYNIKIGFWKLLLMFAVVAVTFVMTLLTIRIFPKLIK